MEHKSDDHKDGDRDGVLDNQSFGSMPTREEYNLYIEKMKREKRRRRLKSVLFWFLTVIAVVVVLAIGLRDGFELRYPGF